MSLSHQPPFPAVRAFVVKFHVDCDPAAGCWRGRLEHMASGRQCEFDSVEALLRRLAEMTPESPAALGER